MSDTEKFEEAMQAFEARYPLKTSMWNKWLVAIRAHVEQLTKERDEARAEIASLEDAYEKTNHAEHLLISELAALKVANDELKQTIREMSENDASTMRHYQKAYGELGALKQELNDTHFAHGECIAEYNALKQKVEGSPKVWILWRKVPDSDGRIGRRMAWDVSELPFPPEDFQEEDIVCAYAVPVTDLPPQPDVLEKAGESDGREEK